MARLSPENIRNRPAYSIGEAARYVRIPAKTLESWAMGREYHTKTGVQHWPALFTVADRRARRLSFVNLVEANTLAAMRRDHRLKIPTIRKALDYVKRQYEVERPLCDQQFESNMVDLFVERFGNLVNVSRDGQIEMAEMMRAALRRVERDPRGIPIRLYAPGANERGRSRFVAFDPTIAFGRPAIVDVGVPVDVIFDRFEAGDSMDALADDYGVTRDAIEEAIRQVGLFRFARAA